MSACRAWIERDALETFYGPPERILRYEDFRDYQVWMADRCLIEPYILMAAEMGLGKTGASLWVIRQRLDRGLVRKVLIVAPLKVAENTWPEEFATWEFARGISYTVLTGSPEDRLEMMKEDTQVHVINRENFVWLRKAWGRHWPYDMLVYDEASRLAGASVKTKPTARNDGSMSVPKLSEFGALCRVRGYFKFIIELSGTPASAGLINLWGPIYLLDEGKRLGASKTAYKNGYFNYDPYNYKLTPHKGSEEEIMSRISDIMVSLREEDYLKLPRFIQTPKYVHLPDPIMKRYREFERDMLIEELDVEAVNSGVLSGKLMQFANGSIYDLDGNDRWVHDHKLDMLGSILEEKGSEPMLIAYSFKFDLARIKKRFPKMRIYGDSANDKRDWDRGRIENLLIHPASAGHGMNFQHGGHFSCWYGMNPSLELWLQFNKRLHRSGQKADTVWQYLIMAKGTEDERMWKVVKRKNATQNSITEHVRVNWRMIRDMQEMI